MRSRRKWLIVPFVFTLFGLLSLNRQSMLSTKEDIQLQMLRKVFDNKFLSDDVSEEATIIYPKRYVQLFAGTLFFKMNVSNERFLGHCSVKEQCRIIDDIKNADAVLYHGPDFQGDFKGIRDDQIAVLWFLESPISFRPSLLLKDRINWTMTYRRDSDIPLPYGIFRKLKTPVKIDYEAIWSAKNNSSVWLISNCAYRNGRLALANAIKTKGFKIDIFGSCGLRTPNNCDGVGKQSDECVTQLFWPYKFAISFENSLCTDYVTEKFFEVLQKRYAVPIVMQRKRYTILGAPNNSFIAVDDFKSATELVRYLHEVENDREKYLSYHRWREHFAVESNYFEIEDTGFCALCKKLLKRDYEPKYYKNPYEWHVQDTCEQPQDAFVKSYIERIR